MHPVRQKSANHLLELELAKGLVQHWAVPIPFFDAMFPITGRKCKRDVVVFKGCLLYTSDAADE